MAAGIISRAVTTTEEVLSLLTAPKLSADKQSKGMFMTTIGFVPEGITFTPDDTAVGARASPPTSTAHTGPHSDVPWQQHLAVCPVAADADARGIP